METPGLDFCSREIRCRRNSAFYLSVSGLFWFWKPAPAAGSKVTASQRKSRQTARNAEETAGLLEKLHAGCLLHSAVGKENQTHT